MGVEIKKVTNPTIGLVGHKITTLFSDSYIYQKRPTKEYTETNFGAQLFTNNMDSPTIFMWMGDDANALNKLIGIINIIVTDEKYKLSDKEQIEQETQCLDDLLCQRYPEDIMRIADEINKAREQEQKEKGEQEEKERYATSDFEKCIFTLVISMIVVAFLIIVVSIFRSN